MVPIAPISTYLRSRQFVREEWDRFFSDGRANVEGEFHFPTCPLLFPSIITLPNRFPPHHHITLTGALCDLTDISVGGWRGILYANLALIDPRASYAFFRDGVNGYWDERWIDGGASRTWYLVWAAAMSEFGRR